MTLSEELVWRGFVHQTTLDDLSQLDQQKFTFYAGYDASDSSLTIGNLALMMMNKCLIRHGHKAVLLAGGATSLIGDPGGKDSERVLQSPEIVAANVESVRQQIERLFGGQVTLVNNLDWFGAMNVLEFLRDVGKHFSMTPLVQRDYIAKRMGEGGSGITYTEFSYTILQGFDFLKLFEDYDVRLQLAGSDQWGNSLSGVELVRRVKGEQVDVLTCPLVINKATGKKFGKSEGGAIWLDPVRTSPYKFYQFWLNVDDEGVEGYLKVYTELDKDHIEKIMNEFQNDRGGRLAQRTLAFEVTKLVHGEAEAQKVKRATEVLFGSESFTELNDAEIEILRQELPVVKSDGGPSQIIVASGLAASNSEATRLMEGGAISINGRKVAGAEDFGLREGSNLLKRGKNNFAIIDKRG